MVEFREIAAGLRFPEGPVALADGSVLLVEVAGGRLVRVAGDGGKSVVAELGGGANGAAIGPDGRCYVCNNGGMRFHERDGRLLPGLAPADFAGGSIQAVDLRTGGVQVLYRECDGHRLNGPNDLVFDRQGGFWFTDNGKVRRRERDRGAVYYAKADGSLIREAVFPMEAPNGIGLSPDGGRLYVAETSTGRLWVFELAGPGEVRRVAGPVPWERGHLLANPVGYHLFDSLAVDSAGNVCVATIPSGVLVFSPDGGLLETLPFPDPFTTNLCFGGPDLRTAYVTLSSTGRLVALPWPRPGLRLAFNS
ncbi:MAG: SMP-30/gluconolactonase/LRE family protein [Alphaproteobacteria bacterium]|nr:SMP-30/gluconolactonase/LRE family protein [Alphaproteobacteria bacterium]